MPLPTAKLLKVGGPLLTGIGGVFATSSLVSKSADEKSEEKLKTAALKDEEPPIEDYEDANEGECKKSAGSECKGGKQGPKAEGEGQSGGGGESGESSGQSQKANERPPNADVGDTPPKAEEQKGEESNSQGEKNEEEASDSGEDDGEESENTGTEEGTRDAEYANIDGTAYGKEDRAMTMQDLERTKSTRDALKDLQSQLMGLAGL